LYVPLDDQHVNRRQFLRGGGARGWLRRRLTPRWWPTAASPPSGALAPAARLLNRVSFPWLLATLVICAVFGIVCGWLPGWLLAAAWLATALGLAALPNWRSGPIERVRAAAGGIVIGAGLAVIATVTLRLVSSAEIEVLPAARWAATAGLALALWWPTTVSAFATGIGRAAGKLRKSVFRF
jgi:hypothetical protein